MKPARAQRGFTLIEMLVVIAIIAILAGLSLAAWPAWRNRAKVSSTRAVVQSIAAAISDYGKEYLTLGSGANERTWRLWNVDQGGGDTILDGHPEVDIPGITSTTHADHLLYAEGYRGFADTIGLEFPWRDQDGHVLDAWKRPMRIRWAMGTYGSSGFGVWSAGKDGVDGTEDDITSWNP